MGFGCRATHQQCWRRHAVVEPSDCSHRGPAGLEGISALGEKALGQPALGLGDAKLAALGGAWLGGAGLTMALGLAVLSGALVGSLGRLSGRLGPRQPFAFGPFIALGIWLVWLQGPEWWWQRWMHLTGSLI